MRLRSSWTGINLLLTTNALEFGQAPMRLMDFPVPVQSIGPSSRAVNLWLMDHRQPKFGHVQIYG